jgi:hypothetical protein
MEEAPEIPRSVALAFVLFAAGLVINYAVVVAGDLPNLGPGQGETRSHALQMFVVAHLTVVPLFTSPVWLPQVLCLWPTYLGKNWARYILPFTIVPVWYFFLGPEAIQAAFDTESSDHVARAWTFWARAGAALSQLSALIILWAPTSSRFFVTSTSYRREAG